VDVIQAAAVTWFSGAGAETVARVADMQLIGRAYFESIRQRYRFYSFGDAMLIL
jgi:hypothetical protein